jgi:hypothetical protein
MPSSFFGLNGISAGTGTPQVRRYNGLSSSTVGNTFSSAQTVAIDATSQPLNRVIQFGSQNTFLALINNSVFRSTDAGVTWTSVFTFSGATNVSGVPDCKTGLNVVYRGGIPTVVFMSALSSFSSASGYYSTDGINWTTDAPTSFASNTSYCNDTIFRNSLCALAPVSAGSGGFLAIYSPGSAISTIAGTVVNPAVTASLCVFNDQLLYMSIPNDFSTTFRRILVLNGGSLQTFSTLATGLTAIGGTGKCGMFVDSNSGDLIAFNRKSIPGAWGCWSVTSAGVATDISSTVLPSGMLSTSASVTARVLCFVDGQASPGSNPTKYVIYSDSNVTGTLETMYKWNGVGSVMTDIDSGGNIRDALSLSENCQGVNFWTSGENSVSLVSRTPTSGGIILNFILYSTGNAAVVNVRAWYGTQLEEYPTRAATLTGTTIGLTADGSTTYQVTWTSTTEVPAVNPGDRFRLIMEVYT